MEIFRCPVCNGTFKVELQAKAYQVRCGHCNSVVTIPGSPQAGGGQGGAAPPRPKPPTRPAANEPPPKTSDSGVINDPDLLSDLQHAATTGSSIKRIGAVEEEIGPPSSDEEATFVRVKQMPLPSVPKIEQPLNTMKVGEILTYGRKFNASDIHIAAGSPVMFRIARRLVPVSKELLTSEQTRRLSMEIVKQDHQRKILEETCDYDLMEADEEGRYRVNVGYFNGNLGMVIRVLGQEAPTLERLKHPPIIKELAHATKGLILITGSASQGKTTTMTAMIDEINRNYPRHIITIEDPIEYEHTQQKGLIRQRQIGMDTRDFSTGLRAALRQNPDVVAIGEMRDYETIKIALTAAETGCLVFSTLHILSIDKIIERLLSFAPSEDEGFIRYVLADTLVGVIHQELVPTITGGKRVAAEVLVVTTATRHIIRNRGTFFLRNVISTGKKFGMIPMSSSLQSMVDSGDISPQTMQEILVNYK